jgi:Na+/phosphate symporter
MIIYLSPLVALIGLLMYGFASNPKLVRIGEIMFACGLLATLFTMSAGSFRLPK